MLKIGEKIKELRKAQDVTQEKLADYLNISYQAVSKWENGLALPDITLLPKLANFFGVSTDELLDLKASENETELRRYEKEYHELGRKGKILEKIELSRKVLDLYPRNYQWMLNLAYGLVSYGATSEQQKYREEHKFVEEAISLCERILEDCTVDSIRHSAIQILCYEYPKMNKKDAAIKLAEDMPNMLICKEMLLSHIYSGTERLKQEQNNLRFMLHFCSSILYLMACDKELRQGLTVDQRIKMLDTAINLNKTMLYDDENENLYNNQLSLYYLMIAKLYCQKNESDMVIKNLWLSEKCAVNYDSTSNLGEQNYNSIYFSKLTWNPQNISTNSDKTLCEELLLNLNDNCFEELKDNAEFIALKERLENSNKTIKFKISDISKLNKFTDSNVKILDWQKDFELINQFYKEDFAIYDLLKDDPDEFESLGTVAYIKDDKIVSLVDIMKINETELEIGAVSTLPTERNKGYCKAVISVAIERILSLGYTAKLTTKNNNIAMQKVAKSIGMTPDKN